MPIIYPYYIIFVSCMHLFCAGSGSGHYRLNLTSRERRRQGHTLRQARRIRHHTYRVMGEKGMGGLGGRAYPIHL